MIRRVIRFGVAIFAIWAMNAEAQGGPRGGGMGRRGGPGGEGNTARFEEMRSKMGALNALNIEAMWMILSFGIGLAPEQLDPLRGPFGEMWARRSSILEDAGKGDKTDWGAIKDEFKDMKKELEQKIKILLKEDQHKAFSKEMKAYEKSLPKFPGVGFGPPEGGFKSPEDE